MPASSFRTAISASAIQALLSQSTGILVFFILSRLLEKSALGQLNWSVATLTIIFSALNLGTEHIAVRRAATDANTALLLRTLLIHVVSAGTIVVGLIAAFQDNLRPGGIEGSLFLMLASAQCISFLGNPFRQLSNGQEKFPALLVMSSTANIVKLLLLFFFAGTMSLHMIARIYLIAAIAELLVCIIFFRRHMGMRAAEKCFSFLYYRGLLREALPQFGVTVLNVAMARMDWILIGVFASSIVVADYSFVNRLFEISTLPLMIIAPILFPKISKQLKDPREDLPAYLDTLLRLEIIIAVLVALMANVCWEAVIDPLTGNKYGNATATIMRIMYVAMPFVYINNIFWTVLIARRQAGAVLKIFLASFFVNVITDMLLIDAYGANGAAAGMVLGLLTQMTGYMIIEPEARLRKSVLHLFPVALAALAAYLVSFSFFHSAGWRIFSAGCIFFAGLIVTKQIKSSDWVITKKMVLT